MEIQKLVKFYLKCIEPLNYFLGVEVQNTDLREQFLSQVEVVKELLDRTKMLKANPINTHKISNHCVWYINETDRRSNFMSDITLYSIMQCFSV